MKPDWKDAPEWANHLTLDSFLEYEWHELDPYYNGEIWISSGREAHAGRYDVSEEKEARPS